MKKAALAFFGLFGYLIIGGCATVINDAHVQESYVRDRWLGFIGNGSVTKADTRAFLGDPTATYNDGSIFAYRLILLADGSMRENACATHRMSEPTIVNSRRKSLPEKGRLIVVRDDMEKRWQMLCGEAEYHLILVFDQYGKVARHALKRLSPP
jgi:hypothetical protein